MPLNSPSWYSDPTAPQSFGGYTNEAMGSRWVSGMDTSGGYVDQGLYGTEILGAPDTPGPGMGAINAYFGSEGPKYDANGEMIVGEQIKKKARYAALSKLLMGAAASILNNDPRHVMASVDTAAEAHRQTINANKAEQIAKRTMQAQEANTAAGLMTHLSQAEKDKLALKIQKDNIEQERRGRIAIGQSVEATLKIYEAEIEEAGKSGEWNTDYGSYKDAKIAFAHARSLAQMGMGDKAMEIVATTRAGLPKYRLERAHENMQVLLAGMADEQAGKAGLVMNPATGEYERVEDRALRLDVMKSGVAQNYAAANQANANAEYIRSGKGSEGGGLTEAQSDDIARADKVWNSASVALRTPSLSGSMGSEKLKELDEYVGALDLSPDEYQYLGSFFAKFGGKASPGMILRELQRSNSNLVEALAVHIQNQKTAAQKNAAKTTAGAQVGNFGGGAGSSGAQWKMPSAIQY